MSSPPAAGPRPAHPFTPESRPLTARDLAALVLLLALTVAPHTLRAPWWLTLLAVALYGWRVAALANPGVLPSRWTLLAVSGAAMLALWLEYGALFGRTPGIMLLVLFSGLKLLETRHQRDACAIVFLSWFLVITNLLYTQSIPTAVALGTALAVSAATLVGFSAPRRALGANLRTAGLLLAQAVPAALALFLLFPRVHGPLWGLPQDAYSAMSGLSETMSPGSISQLTLSDAIAFRAEFRGELPARRRLYWRGPVLWDFDGRTWRQAVPAVAAFEAPDGGAERHDYSVVLEPHNRTWLFALEAAASVPREGRYLDDGQIVTLAPVRTRLRYDMVSVSDAAPRLEAEGHALRRALRLPQGYNPRAAALAAAWRDAASGDEGVLQLAVEYFRRAPLVYTLEPPISGRDTVDEFLFQTRAGFCEHFSAAFVFLMRAAGVPARVVTGYQGGEVNPVDGKFTVRQSDAHAWAEVYLEGRGWMRIDPTALSVPGRIEAGLARAVPEGHYLPLLMRPELRWLRTLRYNWEALAHQWNLWVLGYNPVRQRELLRRLGMDSTDWRELGAALASVLGALIAGLLAWGLRHHAREDPVQRTWRAFCRKLGARGIVRAPHEGPRDYGARAAARLPASGEAIRRIAALYIELRYGEPGAASAPSAELRRRVRAFRPA